MREGEALGGRAKKDHLGCLHSERMTAPHLKYAGHNSLAWLMSSFRMDKDFHQIQVSFIYTVT